MSRRKPVARAVRAAVETLEGRMLLSAGQLDPTFGSGGILPLSLSTTDIRGSTVQPDGKIILVGGTVVQAGAPTIPLSFFVERLNPDGSADTSFGAGGVVTTSFAQGGEADDVVIQNDGKILVGGVAGNISAGMPSGQFAFARYNTNGTPDSTFGTGGKEAITLPFASEFTDLALGANGKFAAAARGIYQDPAHLGDASYAAPVVVAARFNSDGALDTSFNGTGYTYQQIPSQQFSYASTTGAAIAIQPDGKILVGSAFTIDPALWRFNADGSLDTSFGNGGRSWIPLTYSDLDDDYVSGSITSITVLASGKILCGGGDDAGGVDHNWALMQFNANGTPDTTFGSATADNSRWATGGFVNVPLAANADQPGDHPTFPSIVVQSDGKIVLAGINEPFFNPVEALRYNADGTPDNTFTDPQVETDASLDTGPLYTSVTMVFTPTQQPLLLAFTSTTVNPPTTGLSLIRLQNSVPSGSPPAPVTPTPAPSTPGNLNAGFGVNGNAFINDPTSVWLPNSVERTVRATAVQADGKVILAGSVGTTATGGIGQIFVERLNANGSVDTSFGTSGIVTTTFGPASFATMIQIQSDGKILVGGATEDNVTAPTDQTFALVRYNTNGSLDTSFGVGGKLTTSFAGNAQINSLALYSNGDIVAVGSYFLYPNAGFHIAHYNSSGALETAFGTGGTVTVNLGTAPDNSEATALALQSDGKLLIGTHQNTSPLVTPVVMRYNQNGTVDTTFGSSGIAAVPFVPAGGSLNSGTAGAIAVLSSGQIVVAVDDVQPSASTSQYIVRITASGQEDPAFQQTALQNNGNVASIPGSNVPDEYRVLGLFPLQDGSVLVDSQQVDWDDMNTGIGLTALITKVLANGTIDPSFAGSVDPHVVSQPYFQGQIPRASAVSSNGSLFIAFDAYADKVQSTPHWMAVADYIGGAAAVIPTAPASTLGSAPVTPPVNNPPPPTTPTTPANPTTPTTPTTPTDPTNGGTPIATLPAGQLTCTVISATPAKAMAGAKGVMVVKIKNTGSAAWSGPVSINVYASTDSTLSISDTLLATLNVATLSLKAGKTANVRVPFVFSSDLSTAKYMLLASVTETSAGTAAYTAATKRAVALTAAAVDLSISFNTKKLVKLKSGKPNKLALLIKNLGNVKATGTMNLTLTGSSTSVVGESLATLSAVPIKLASKKSQHVVLTFTPPADLGSTFNLTALVASSISPADANAANDTATVESQVS